MGNLESYFSEENMLAYSGACLNLAENIPEHMISNQTDTLVIPSRGAVPFFLGMTYALPSLGLYSSEHNQFYSNLAVQDMLKSLIPISVGNVGDREGSINVLLAPFTADLNVEKFDKTQCNDEYTKLTRVYWANVTASFFQQPRDRKNNPFFRSFTDVILRNIERRDSLAVEYITFPRVSRFSMIDTVISGRAASDILGEFDNLADRNNNPDFKASAFLVVDDNGRRLKNPYSIYLKRKELAGKVKMYNIPKIVSEDKGASLLGVCATIYPSVMVDSRNLRFDGKEFFVGAGSWHLGRDLGENNTYNETFMKFMDLVYTGIDVKLSQGYLRGEGTPDHQKKLDEFKDKRRAFVDYAETRSLLCIEDPDVSMLPLSWPQDVVSPYETSSHVVHIPFSRPITEGITSRLCNIIGVSYKPKE